MKRRDSFHEALSALVAFTGNGRFVWGEPLVVTDLAAELGLSPTPVREALARLAGEGLIDHRPGRGYFALSPGAADLADFLEQHRRLVHWALDVVAQAPDRLVFGPIDGASAERVFSIIARAPERPVIMRAHWRTTLQLRPFRRVQARIAPLDAEWSSRLQPLLLACDIQAIRGEVDQHHRESGDIVSAVTNDLRRASQSIVQI